MSVAETHTSQYFFVPGAASETWSSGNRQTATFCKALSEL